MVVAVTRVEVVAEATKVEVDMAAVVEEDTAVEATKVEVKVVCCVFLPVVGCNGLIHQRQAGIPVEEAMAVVVTKVVSCPKYVFGSLCPRN